MNIIIKTTSHLDVLKKRICLVPHGLKILNSECVTAVSTVTAMAAPNMPAGIILGILGSEKN